MSKSPSRRKARFRAFVVSSGGATTDWNVSSASHAHAMSETFSGQRTIKARPTVVSTTDRGQRAIFMAALNRRLAGYSIAEEEQEPTDLDQAKATSELSSEA